MRCYFLELERYFHSYLSDWLSHSPVPLMERVVIFCQSRPAQWTNVTNTFGALIVFELHKSVAHFTFNINSYSTSGVAGFDAARILLADACAMIPGSCVQYFALYEDYKAGRNAYRDKVK